MKRCLQKKPRSHSKSKFSFFFLQNSSIWYFIRGENSKFFYVTCVNIKQQTVWQYVILTRFFFFWYTEIGNAFSFFFFSSSSDSPFVSGENKIHVTAAVRENRGVTNDRRVNENCRSGPDINVEEMHSLDENFYRNQQKKKTFVRQTTTEVRRLQTRMVNLDHSRNTNEVTRAGGKTLRVV